MKIKSTSYLNKQRSVSVVTQLNSPLYTNTKNSRFIANYRQRKQKLKGKRKNGRMSFLRKKRFLVSSWYYY